MSATEPTDADIVARLAAQPEVRWAKLLELAGRLSRAGTDVRWREARTQAEGTIQVGYPLYSETASAIQSLLYEMEVVVPFDWMEWDGVRRFPRGRGLSDAPVSDAVRLATAIVRSERFNEGSLAQALSDGTFVAVLDRLRHWYVAERTR